MNARRARAVPVLAALSLVMAVAPALAAPAPGPVVAWGYHGQGQIGDGTTVDRVVPVPVCAVGQTAPCPGQLTRALQVAAGDDDLSAALLAVGPVLAWGDGVTGADRPTPTRVCATARCTVVTGLFILC